MELLFFTLLLIIGLGLVTLVDAKKNSKIVLIGIIISLIAVFFFAYIGECL